MRRFLDEEAELGSDNEEHDEGKAKSIDRNAEDERDDDGHDDSDLDGFVDNEQPAGDDEEIAAGNAAAYEAFQMQIQDDEKQNVKNIFSAVLLGNNKKRKRGQIDLEDLDEAEKRKLRAIERRGEPMNSAEEEE